jgi:tetratricopeptide (TPR) repeat protein
MGPLSSRPDRVAEATARVETLLTASEKTSDPTERADLLIDMALVLRDELRDKTQALDALVAAWRADPTHPELLDHLEPLARSQNRWHEIMETTRQLIGGERVATRSMAYSEAMVCWLTREVPHPDLAQQYLERVRKIDSTHWLLHLFQAAKYEEHGDGRRELEALDRAVLSAKRASDRVRIHLLMAQRYLAERTANPTEAKRHFRKAHELAPSSMEALRGLEQIHLAEGDVAALGAVLEKQVEAVENGEERAATLLRVAELYEKEFVKPEVAAAKFEQAFALDPSKDEALAGLERCYAATRNWQDFVRVIEGAVVLVDDVDVRAERLIRLAEIYESRLCDFAGAVRAFEQLATILPDDETLIGELARLSEKIDDWKSAVRHRVKLAELSRDPSTKARMHVTAGQLLVPHDPVAARAHFEMAIDFDPTNASAYTALLSDARVKGDLARVANYLERRVKAATGPRQQAQIYAELGDVLRALGDEYNALAAWEAARSADPNHEGASRALLDAYVATKRWDDAAPLCNLVLHAAERDQDWERLYITRCQAFAVAWELGRRERALDLILGAYSLHPEEAYARESLVAAAWSLRDDPQVLQAADSLGEIAHTREGLPRETLVQLAQVLARVGDQARAMAVFDDVLAIDPNDATALEGLAGLRAARGESIAAWMLKRQLAEGTEDHAARFALLVETADGLSREANRPDLAAEVYEQARAMRPKDHVVLHKLLAQYQTLEEWPRVFDVLRAIVNSDDDNARRAKVLTTMASIAQAKLADPMSAVNLYDEALELDPTRLECFERIVKILTAAKDSQALALMYKRMIARATARNETQLEHALHMQLGLIYRDRLHDRDRALGAFRQAAMLRPDDEQAQKILRELLTTSGRPDDAVAITLARVLDDPLEPGPYPALFDLLMQLGRYDRAWCVASVMAHVGATHAPAASLLAGTPPIPVENLPGTLGQDGWQRLLHRELDPTLTTMFGVMAEAALQTRLAALGLRERLSHPGPPLKQPPFLMQDVARASHVLGVAAPRLFVAKAPPAISVAVTRPPSLLVHPDSLPGFPRNLLAFWIGKRLAELTPPLLARGLFRSVTELKELVASAARIVDGKRMERSDAALRAHITRPHFDLLAGAVGAVLAGGAALDVKRWSQLADLSTSRIGLVLTGDVESARLALMQEAQSPGDLSPREQMRELALFFLSDEYSQIRANLGVALRPR